MKRFGEPRLGIYGGTAWHAHIKMHVASAGSTFEIASDFNVVTPTAAVDQCIERIRATLQQMGAAA